MFCRLEELPSDLSAADVLDAVYDALLAQYDEESVTLFDRSVTVLIPGADGLYVDVVPARPSGEHWEIPTSSGSWIATNPVEMGILKEAKNDEYDGKYVPCVKLLRQVRRTLLGRQKFGGFVVEMALYKACEDGLVSGDTMAEFFASATEGVSEVFRQLADEALQLPDPSMDGEQLQFDEEADFKAAAEKFAAAAVDARSAFETAEADAGKAALLLQGIFGSNDDYENIFPMPAGFDRNGNKRANVQERTSGARQPTAGDLRFG